MQTPQLDLSKHLLSCNDTKVISLLHFKGMEGLGIYVSLVNLLIATPGNKFPFVMIPILAKRFNVHADRITNVITDWDLFDIDGEDEYFSLLNHGPEL